MCELLKSSPLTGRPAHIGAMRTAGWVGERVRVANTGDQSFQGVEHCTGLGRGLRHRSGMVFL
ncbi:hypothetical protein E2C01_003515 [Portunus trituberculatus]|uniref:Uncharacterized protein n=1 Tax=Portunus trituberculatus TaxID=210409 RepID=A0A5B7CPZ5_PORTR|nr:hypothetical protein [Portunus trituberculatus]